MGVIDIVDDIIHVCGFVFTVDIDMWNIKWWNGCKKHVKDYPSAIHVTSAV